jgi:hypothetical protein
VDILSIVLAVGAAVARAVLDAISAGDVSAVESLRGVLKDPAAQRALSDALVAAQRERAKRELPGAE